MPRALLAKKKKNVTVNSEELIGNTTDVIGEVSYKPMLL